MREKSHGGVAVRAKDGDRPVYPPVGDGQVSREAVRFPQLPNLPALSLDAPQQRAAPPGAPPHALPVLCLSPRGRTCLPTCSSDPCVAPGHLGHLGPEPASGPSHSRFSLDALSHIFHTLLTLQQNPSLPPRSPLDHPTSVTCHHVAVEFHSLLHIDISDHLVFTCWWFLSPVGCQPHGDRDGTCYNHSFIPRAPAHS